MTNTIKTTKTNRMTTPTDPDVSVSFILESLNEILVSTEDAQEGIHIEVAATIKDVYHEVKSLRAVIKLQERSNIELSSRLGYNMKEDKKDKPRIVRSSQYLSANDSINGR